MRMIRARRCVAGRTGHGDKEEDWTIEYEPTAVRYQRGIERMHKGDRYGFAQAMYARVFYPNGGGDYESSRGLDNDVLGLPQEGLDERTKHAKEMIEAGYSYF